jgi:Fe-S cluster biogenesis protein NfuA
MPKAPRRLLDVLQTVLAPLIEADGGQLYLVSNDPASVRLHLAGTCCGCPGARITTQWVIEPAIHSVVPKARVEVTAGWLIPSGAERIEAPRS